MPKLAVAGALLSIGAATLSVNEKAVADTNIAPYSIVRSSPYLGASIQYLTDQRTGFPERDNTLMLAAPLTIRNGMVMPLELEFEFPSKAAVTGIRILQHKTIGRRPASGYVIELDTTGDRNYQQRIVSESQGDGGLWFEYRLPRAVEAYGLSFRTTAFSVEPGPNYGGPAIREFEILATADPPVISSGGLRPAPRLEAQKRPSAPLEGELTNPRPWADQFQRGTFGSMWLFWSPDKGYREENNAALVDVLRKLNVNRYWLYPGVYVRSDPVPSFVTKPTDPAYAYYAERLLNAHDNVKVVPFPSSVVLGSRENALTEFVRIMHRANIGVIANESLLPIGLEGWDFPRVPDFEVYPSVRCSSFVRDASTQLYREYMESGVDGLVLGGDEFFLRIHPGTADDVAPVCGDGAGNRNGTCAPSCAEVFDREYGIAEIPNESEFTLAKAKWVLFQYTQLASLFSGLAEMMKSLDPDVIVTSLFRAAEGNRTAYGIAYDIMGSSGRIHELSTDPYWSHDNYLGHYYFASETKKLLAGSSSRKAVITLQTTPHFDRSGYSDQKMLYGPAFSALMHGIRGINFYKHDYFFSGGRNDAGPLVERFFRLVRHLEERDLLEYEVPKNVAVLYSRASEDWWALKHQNDPVLAAEATLYQNATMEVLFRNGIPFNLYYLDQPDTLSDLEESSLVILPFPHSVPEAAVGEIRRALSSGSNVLALQSEGEADEYGAPRESSLFSRFPEIERRKIPLDGSNYATFEKALMHHVVRLLGADRPLVLETDGADVECSLLSKENGRLVFCFNWDDHTVEINLGLSLDDDGQYAIRMISLDGDSPATIGGRSEFDASRFPLFRLELQSGEPLVLAVQR